MGVLAKLLGAHGSNVVVTLAAVYLTGRSVSCDWNDLIGVKES